MTLKPKPKVPEEPSWRVFGLDFLVPGNLEQNIREAPEAEVELLARIQERREREEERRREEGRRREEERWREEGEKREERRGGEKRGGEGREEGRRREEPCVSLLHLSQH